jgi:hypothetical protein
MNSNAEQILALGSSILKPLLLSHGFTYKALNEGISSGGHFASGEFRKGSRRLQFHFRNSLGKVTYHLGSGSMSHQEYMRLVLGKPDASHYPGFSSDPLDGFRHLLQDLEEHCADFLDGSDNALLRRIEDAHAQWDGRPKLP